MSLLKCYVCCEMRREHDPGARWMRVRASDSPGDAVYVCADCAFQIEVLELDPEEVRKQRRSAH